MAETLTEQLAVFVVETNYDDLPADIVVATKRRILDTLGCAWAGSTAPGCDGARQTILAEQAPGAATIWASGERVAARGAAFVNGLQAAALDYDSVHEKGSVHPDIVTVPAAWALAEETGASGRDFLAAVALGTEIACRFGAANEENRGWFHTSTHGVFGGAAASAKLLGLDAGAIADALGLAFFRAGGSQQALLDKRLAKRAASGLAAESAVFAARLAQAGIDGPRRAVEGKYSYHALHGPGDGEQLVANLGAHWEQAAVTIKNYPSCTANHVPNDLLIDIAEEADLDPGEVEAVEVAISPFADGLVGAAFHPADNPQVAAQFSIHYSAASALLRRRLGIAEIQADAVPDGGIADFIAKIDIRVERENAGKFAPAGVAVATTGGRVIERRLDFVPGTPQNPLSDAQVQSKFRDCAGFGMTPLDTNTADALAARLGALDAAGGIGDLLADVHG